jgi:mono/diheme cytochrome c family protein
MRKILKIVGIFVGILIGLALLCAAYTFFSTEARFKRTYQVGAASIPIPANAASLERGEQLVIAGRCTECHGASLGGRRSMDDPGVGTVYASNLTAGKGGVGQYYTDADWVRAIRHGIGPDGRSLLITPAQFYYYLSDEDLGAIIAYLKNAPPVETVTNTQNKIEPIGRLLLAVFNPPDWLPAEKIDHTGPRPPAPSPGLSAGYGEYLVRLTTCLVCHTPMEISAAMGGALAGWSEDDFIRLMHRGRTPSGTFVDGDYMPFNNMRELSETDLKAMWLYLETLPPEESMSR